MKNIFDIRQENQDVYLLPCNVAWKDGGGIGCAVIMNLYYTEDVNFYLDYLSNIPEEIPVYVYSSNSECLSYVKEKMKRSRTAYLKKTNRGRDVSALLVAARSVIEQYEFICFIHDKSANAEYLRKDVECWKKSLWDNMLCSTDYIYNILQKFREMPDLGLLAPPEPYGDYISSWYGDTWGADYELTVDLAEKLGIKADISVRKNVYTMGTVFWARTAALKKLLHYGWSYEDFPEEPLPMDGTVSHAVERILGYAAFDAGYKTGTVMTESHAAGLLLKAQQDMRMMFSMIAEKEHVFNMHQVKIIEAWKNQLKHYAAEHTKVYVYGAGSYGYAVRKIMDDNHLVLEGFVVSPGRRKAEKIGNTNVYELQELCGQPGIGIVIGVSYEYREEIHAVLEEKGFSDYMDGF